MHMLLDVALSNAIMAVLLALLAGVVGACCRRPALVHGLWLLVLLKLLTPPLFHVPIPSFHASEPAEPVAPLADHPEPTKQPADVPRRIADQPAEGRREKRQDGEAHEQRPEIEGKNTEDPPCVEKPKVVRQVFRSEQNRADQKTRDHKE